MIPLKTGLITDNCLALLLLFSLSLCFPLPPTPPSSLNGFMGCGLSNVVAKCHFLFYWNDSSLRVVVEVRSTFMKFALWLISRSVEVSFSLSVSSLVGGGEWNKLYKFSGPCSSDLSLILKCHPPNETMNRPKTPYLYLLLCSQAVGVASVARSPEIFGLRRGLGYWLPFCLCPGLFLTDLVTISVKPPHYCIGSYNSSF